MACCCFGMGLPVQQSHDRVDSDWPLIWWNLAIKGCPRLIDLTDLPLLMGTWSVFIILHLTSFFAAVIITMTTRGCHQTENISNDKRK